jgi:hypothetical protein
LRIQRGDAESGVSQLQALYNRSQHAPPPGSLVFRAYDQCVVSSGVSNLSNRELRSALEHDSGDSPNFLALKVRALARAGMHDEAHAQLRAISPARVTCLSRDRDYLGTLAALAHAVIDLRAYEYVAGLYDLLAEYSERFVADASFCCEPVAQVMALLARSQGRHEQATALLAKSDALADRAGVARAWPAWRSTGSVS